MAEGWLGAQAPPRAPLPGLPPPATAQPRTREQGAGAAAGATQHHWPGNCGSQFQEPLGGQHCRPAPPRPSPSLQAASAAPKRACRVWPGATAAPPPPLLSRRPSPRGPWAGGGRCGPQALRVLPGADPGPPGARLRCG